MTTKVFINGFGRIGRNVLRAIVESKRKDIEVVGINDLGPVATNAHLLRFDSVHGRFPATVEVDGDFIVVAGKRIRVTAIKDRPSFRTRNSAWISPWNAPASSPPRRRPRRISRLAPSACSFRRPATAPTRPSSTA